MYDVRNLDRSGSGDKGVCGVGRDGWRNCVGAEDYVVPHPELSETKVGPPSRRTGGSDQYEAISHHPELLDNAIYLVGPLVVSMDTFTKNDANLFQEGSLERAWRKGISCC